MRHFYRWNFLLVVFALLTVFSNRAFSETVKVGVLLHLTGDLASFGQMQKESLLMAWHDNEEEKKIQGRSIELIIEDIPTDPAKARSSVENLINQQQPDILLCGISSAPALEASSAAQLHRVPLLIHFASATLITEQGRQYVFRLNPPLGEYTHGLLWFLTEVVKPKTVAMIGSKGFAGTVNPQNLADYCRKAGHELVFKYIYEQDTTDFRPVLKQLKEKNPDVIYMASYLKDAVSIMQQCKELDINPLLFVGMGGGFTMPEFGKMAGDAANYLFSISLWSPSVPYPGAKEYYAKYEEKYSTPPDYHGAEAYAAMQVIEDVLGRVKSKSRESIRESLASTNISTIMGKVKFLSYGKKTQQNRMPTYLVQWFAGKMETVWPPNAASSKYVYPWPKWNERAGADTGIAPH
jgi:branched-chain amino acid transport system substrate-binding protein